MWALGLTFAFMCVEASAGWLSGSLTLLADAGHMLADVLALALTYFGFVWGAKPADARRTFGYRRIEVLAAWANGLLLLGLCVAIAIEAVRRLYAPVAIEAGIMVWVALAGLAINVGVYGILRAGERENINIRGAILHVLGDIFGSAAAIAAGLAIVLTGKTRVDPALSLLVALLIARSAWELLDRTTHILLEGAPEWFDDKRLRSTLAGLPDVLDVHDVHAWVVSSGRPLVSVHIRLRPGADARDALAAVKRHLAADLGITHSVVQVEIGLCPDHDVHP